MWGKGITYVPGGSVMTFLYALSFYLHKIPLK